MFAALSRLFALVALKGFFCNAFVPFYSSHQRPCIHLRDAPPPFEEEFETAALQQWNASGSFGSLLMQMQRKEARNETTLQEECLDLDPVRSDQGIPQTDNKPTTVDDSLSTSTTRNETSTTNTTTTARPAVREIGSASASFLPTLDVETAQELDEAVTLLTGPPAALTQALVVQPLSPIYQTSKTAQQNATTVTTLPPWSRPDHYQDRLDRDLRLLALSIATCTESVDDWRMVNLQLSGGLGPLLETVRVGAQMATDSKDHLAHAAGLVGNSEHGTDQAFLAACNACRAIRNLCAIEPELAAVVTDGVLRAHAARNGGVLRDLRTLLYQASDNLKTESSSLSAEQRLFRRPRREDRLHGKLYVHQLLLAMAVASDDAVAAIRACPGLIEAILSCSSYARKERRRRWLRYPGELVKWVGSSRKGRRPFMEAASIANDLNGEVQKTANQLLAAVGYNQWVPKTPGQRGLRILSLDGGGSRGMTAITAVKCLMEAIGNGADVADSFDIIAGTSTGGIIAFLTGLRRETSEQAAERYNQLIRQIFVKSALSTPLMVFTTATYDESPFMDILSKILKDNTMLDSRQDPAVPLVFCVTSKMSSTPTHVALFRNYNYGGGEIADPFTIDPDKARLDLGLPLEREDASIQNSTYTRNKYELGAPGQSTGEGSRYPGSFRVLQRYALRASTAAPTVFKPVMMGGEMYCDGGIVASNPAAVAIHEARTLFPDIPIEMVVSVGTGAFLEQKSAPRIGWDGIIGQIVDSATDGEQIHHLLEDVMGDSAVLGTKKSSVSRTKYYRFNPVIGLPDEFPIDVTDPEKLERLRSITREYMKRPNQQAKVQEISTILSGGGGWTKRVSSLLRRKKK